MVISHRHVTVLGGTLGNLKTEFKIFLVILPIDAKHKQALPAGEPRQLHKLSSIHPNDTIWRFYSQFSIYPKLIDHNNMIIICGTW
ncbi:MAG: hypothetical protein E6K94_09315 [Thaumarchaeota archaeon]|nr:MAG: hypothetical protein E6K94_09315 [Nitrososphaerota archaeon]